ncbi:unnamed protein product [Schistosoma curassoni]|uniref:GAR domain-containing protein n=1 Tax=Schistosoma curassoni TaxID=6186 RepID=A0A183KUC5_9TREM|nr:unnamed protein product [Schistosoma curassoni]
MEQSINNDQTKLDESKSMESFTENVLSFHSTFISEFNDQLLNYSSMLNNRFNVYLNEIGTVLNEIQLDLNQWTSYVDSKLRLEKWLNMVEFDWKVNQLTDSDEVGDNLTNKMYFVTLYKKFEEWLSNTETKLNYMIEDIVARIEHLIPESESYSITSNNEYNPNLSIGTQFINKDNNLSIYIEKIDKLWLSIMNNAESQLDTLNSLFLSIEKEVEHPENFQIKINNFKNHIFLNLKQKINDLIKNLKEYQHYNEEFLNQLSRIKQTSLSQQNILIINNDYLDKHLNYINNYLKRLKKYCEDLTQCWQLAVDNHLKFQKTFQSCSMEFQMIKSEFIEGCPFNDEMELTNILNNNDNNNHEISSKTKWNGTDQIYHHFLGWLSNLMNKLDRFTVISYQSCIELLQLTSLTTSLKGYNLMNEQLIELKKSADQLSTDLVELYHRIELTMIEHLKMDQEKYELKNWLNEHEQKLIELNKPLEVVLSFDNIISSSSTSSESLRSSLFSLNAILSSWSMLMNERQSNLQSFRVNNYYQNGDLWRL